MNHLPVITKNLILWNSAVYILINLFTWITHGSEGLYSLFMRLGLSRIGFLEGGFWQPITSMFLHGGFLHLFMNMLGLWSIGPILERRIGSKRFFELYFFSGIIGAIFVLLFQDSNLPTIGASGAISGLLGALAIVLPETRMLFFFIPMRAGTLAIVMGLISLVFAFDSSGQISHLGHLGGLLGGVFFIKWKLDAGMYHRESPGLSLFGRNFIEPELKRDFIYQHKKPEVYYDPYTGRFIIKI